MIDRETAIEWADDAGFKDEFLVWTVTTEEIQALITRAMNEAYERAATEIEFYDDPTTKNAYVIDSSECTWIIRRLKKRGGKK